jgi:hypothetical protein
MKALLLLQDRKEGRRAGRPNNIFSLHGLPELPDDELGFNVPGPFGDMLALTRRR